LAGSGFLTCLRWGDFSGPSLDVLKTYRYKNRSLVSSCFLMLCKDNGVWV
jgi:hypothetical protein